MVSEGTGKDPVGILQKKTIFLLMTLYMSKLLLREKLSKKLFNSL